MKTNPYLKNKKLACCLLQAALLMVSNTVLAQTDSTHQSVLSRDVVVSKTYVPTQVKVNKIMTTPAKEEYNPDKPELKYSEWSQAEEVSVSTDKMRPEAYDLKRRIDAKKGLFKAGLGFYWQVLGEFYYPLLQGDKYLLDIDVKHLSNWGQMTLSDGTVPRAARQFTSAALNFESQIRDCRLRSELDFSYNCFDYYGLSTAANDSLRNTLCSYTTVGAGLNLLSTNTRRSFQYGADFYYRYVGRNHGVNEHNLDLGADLSWDAGAGRFGVDMRVRPHLYSITDSAWKANFPSTAYFGLTPYYKWGKKRWDLKLGADLYVLAGRDLNRHFGGAANIEGRFALVPDLFYLHAAIKGNFAENNYSSLLRENPYLCPNQQTFATYTPLDLSVGLKVNIMTGLLLDVDFDYSLILDQYYYVNDTIGNSYYNTFSVVREPLTNRLTAGVGLYFTQVKNLDIRLNGQYQYWGTDSCQHAWQMPAWQIKLDASYQIGKKWKVGLGYHFLGGRHALVAGEDIRMRNIHDINVFASYQVLDWMSIFANGKNLLNIKADTYYGYRTFGANGMIGVCMKF